MKLTTAHIERLIYLENVAINPKQTSATRLRLLLDLHSLELVSQDEEGFMHLTDKDRHILKLLVSTLNNAVQGN